VPVNTQVRVSNVCLPNYEPELKLFRYLCGITLAKLIILYNVPT